MRARSRTEAGMTLLELLIGAVSTVLILAALAGAYSMALRWQEASASYAANLEREAPFEDGLRRLFASAYLTSDAADTASYFVASNSAGAAEGSDTVSFTRIADPPSSRALQDTDDFETRNERHGVLGGLEEASLSPQAVGAEAQGEGLFLRRQRPSDGEPTQGGRESLFSEGLQEISYEFFNGLEWVAEWDTNGVGPRRLPAAVRVTYRLQDQDEPRTLTIPLKHSDATSENPAVLEGDGG